MFKKTLIFLVFLISVTEMFAEPITYGDVNGDRVINIVDALQTARYSVGLNPPGFDLRAADVYLDERIEITDALIIAQYYVGLVDLLPITPPGKGVVKGTLGYLYKEDSYTFFMPLPGGDIEIGGQRVSSGNDGEFIVYGLEEGESFAVFHGEGYFDNYGAFDLRGGETLDLGWVILAKERIISISGDKGGIAGDPEEGWSVSFSPGSFVDGNGEVYLDEVRVRANSLIPGDKGFVESYPGSWRGVNALGEEIPIASYGVIRVEAFDNLGNSLRLNPGAKAEISLKAAPADAPPGSIPLWSLEGSTGKWIEEGTAELRGDRYVGEVSSLMGWGFNIPLTGETLSVEGTVFDSLGDPRPGARVKATGSTSFATFTSTYSRGDGTFEMNVYKTGDTCLFQAEYNPGRSGLEMVKFVDENITDLNLELIPPEWKPEVYKIASGEKVILANNEDLEAAPGGTLLYFECGYNEPVGIKDIRIIGSSSFAILGDTPASVGIAGEIIHIDFTPTGWREEAMLLITSDSVYGEYFILNLLGDGELPSPPSDTAAQPIISIEDYEDYSRQVSISTITGGAEIRYTTDGSAPSGVHGHIYSGPFIISSLLNTIKAIACKTGWKDSPVQTKEYIISPYKQGDLSYEYIPDMNGVEVIDYDQSVSGELIIPGEINGFPVTSIGEGAFYNCKSLTGIDLPDGVTSIGKTAFWGCSGLTSINLPSGVTSIGDGAFSFCRGLTSIDLPAGVAFIGESAFTGCYGLTSIDLPDGMTSIGVRVFEYCSGLTSVYLPADLTSIGAEAFSYCRGLKSIDFPAGVTSIGERAFEYCYGLTSIDLPSGLTSIENRAFSYCPGLTSINLPSGLTSIGERAFTYCYGLTSIDLPAGVTSIGMRAFAYCSGLTSIDLPSGVTSIDEKTFLECFRLTSINLPAGLTSIGYEAFSGCSGLTSIDLPAGVTLIDDLAFSYCSGLTRMDLPSGVTSIGIMTFAYCSGLTSIDLPEDLAFIGSRAFAYCSGLTRMDLPAGVTSIGDLTFAYCSGLTIMDLPADLTSIGDEAFSYCRGLKNIDLPAGVTSIGDGVFSGCSGLISIDLPAGLDSIGDEAFSHTGLTNIELPAGVTSIGVRVFSYCSGLTSVELPAGVTSIGDGAFTGCSGLISIDLPAGLDSIGAEAFSHTGLTNIELPVGVTSIGARVFSYCSGLTSIDLPAGVTSIGKGAFSYCFGLTRVDLPAGLTSIDQRAFYWCSGLTSIIIPDKVVSIKDWAFENCDGLIDISVTALTAPELGQESWPLGATIHIYPEATGYSEGNWENVILIKDL